MKTRLFELDSYKAILIFIMVASHALEMVFSHGYGDFGFCADSGFSVFVEDFMFLAGPLGFMVMMGVLISFGGKRDPVRQIRRGLWLLLIWFALNVARAVPTAILDRTGFAGNTLMERIVSYAFANDIFFFAGLFFVFVGVLRRFGATDLVVFGVSALLYGVSLFVGDIGRFVHPPFHRLTAGFVQTGHWSSFPFIAWAIIPSVGMLFGPILARFGEDRRRLYAVLLSVSALVLVALSPLLCSAGLFDGEKLLAMRGNALGLHANGPLPLACGLAMCGVIISSLYFLVLVLGRGRLGVAITYLGRGLPLVYVVQWVLIPLIALVTRSWLVPLSDGAVVVGCLAIAAASIAVAEVAKRIWRRLHG